MIGCAPKDLSVCALITGEDMGTLKRIALDSAEQLRGAGLTEVLSSAWQPQPALVVRHCASPASVLAAPVQNSPGVPEERLPRWSASRQPADSIWRSGVRHNAIAMHNKSSEPFHS